MKYAIGTKFMARNGAICEVRDILTTCNSAGEIVKTRYVAVHSLMGQFIPDYDVVDTTISMGIARMEQKLAA